MAGVAENQNVRVTLTLEKNQRLKWCVGGNDFPLSDYRTTIKRLLRDYQTTFPLRCGNFILTATYVYVSGSHMYEVYLQSVYTSSNSKFLMCNADCCWRLHWM